MEVFKLFYHGVDGERNGVGVFLKEEYSKSVVEVKRVSDRVMKVKLEVEGEMINVLSAYAPQVGCEIKEKEKFCELDEVVDVEPRNERLVIGADIKGHVGEGNRGDEEVMVAAAAAGVCGGSPKDLRLDSDFMIRGVKNQDTGRKMQRFMTPECPLAVPRAAQLLHFTVSHLWVKIR
ncbi:hypothetical protein C0J45_22937 [Silurus meridionalis]|nr:hypothetical protein C0J45_22937 [Silurus meridionalis]